jgi:PhnB protein
MATLNPYLNFNGNTEAAFTFYKSVFGGEYAMVQRFKDTPEAGKIPAKDQDKIMHIALPIGKGNILMATDALESMGQKLKPGNNFHLSFSADSEAETERLFNALSAGGVVMVPLSKQFWGAYFGMCIDKFGVQWMVSFDENQLPK